MSKTNRDVINKFIELNKILNNICIIHIHQIRSSYGKVHSDN
jgi:hypothetical protein